MKTLILFTVSSLVWFGALLASGAESIHFDGGDRILSISDKGMECLSDEVDALAFLSNERNLFLLKENVVVMVQCDSMASRVVLEAKEKISDIAVFKGGGWFPFHRKRFT